MENIKQFVRNEIESYDSDYEKISFLKDVLQYGCQSGLVSSLVYYSDTNKFFDDYEDEIVDLISNIMEDMGYKTRPQFIDSLNGSAENITQEKNLLAWVAFEEASREVLMEDFGVQF